MDAQCELERRREEPRDDERDTSLTPELDDIAEATRTRSPAGRHDGNALVAIAEASESGEEAERQAPSSPAERGSAGALEGAVCSAEMEEEEEERALRELARSLPLSSHLSSGLESLRSESGICSSLDSNYLPDGAAPDELERLEARLRREQDAELERARRQFQRQKRADIQRAIGAKNDEIRRLRAWLQTDARQLQAAPNREATTQSLEQETLRLKSVIRRLEAERDELKAEAQLCRIREKQRTAELRRQRLQHERELRRQLQQQRRDGVRESRELARLRAATDAKNKEIADRDKQIDKLEAQKCYLGEEIFRLTGIEEGFWSDQNLVRAKLSDRERGLVRRASELGSKVTQLQVQCRSLQLDNSELRTCIDSELDVPLAIRARAAQSSREAQVLRRKNQELLNTTKKLEDKIKTLEKAAAETPDEGRPKSRLRPPARRLPSSRAVPVEVQVERAGPSAERSSPLRERGAHGAARSASVRERTASRAAREPPRAVSAGPRASAAAAAAREDGAAPAPQRESQYQRQIAEKNAQLQQLREEVETISQQLSSRSEVQKTLRENGRRELELAIQQLQDQKRETEDKLNVTIEALRQERGADQERLKELRADNDALQQQLRELDQLAEVHEQLRVQFDSKADECQQLKGELQNKQKLCQDLEGQFSRVIEKNTELTIQNSDLQRQVIELDRVTAQCTSLEQSLSSARADYGNAQMELDRLRTKAASLETVLQQMREAAERRKELERQHTEAQQQLKQLSQQSEQERQGSLVTIRGLESKVRELKRKTEAQSLRHEELMLEMTALKKQQRQQKPWPDSSPDGTITPDWIPLSNESTARSTPASGDPLTEVELHTTPGTTTGSSQRRTDIQLPAAAVTTRPAATALELDKIMAKIDNDNKVLAEMDKNRSTIGVSNSLATSGSARTQSTFLTTSAPPLSSALSQQRTPLHPTGAPHNALTAPYNPTHATYNSRGAAFSALGTQHNPPAAPLFNQWGSTQNSRLGTQYNPVAASCYQPTGGYSRPEVSYNISGAGGPPAPPPAAGCLLAAPLVAGLGSGSVAAATAAPPLQSHLPAGPIQSHLSGGLQSHLPAAPLQSHLTAGPLQSHLSAGLQSHLSTGLQSHLPAGPLQSRLAGGGGGGRAALTQSLTSQLTSQLGSLLPGALSSRLGGVLASPLSASLTSRQKSGLPSLDKRSVPVNGIVPGLLPPAAETNLARLIAHNTSLAVPAAPHLPQPAGKAQPPVDVLDIPGKGRCQVHIARYSYDPFKHSPNDAPESELRLNAGDYVLIWGAMDEDGFLDGETLDGRRGLVPSNFVQKLVGADLLEFQRQVAAGLRADWERASSVSAGDLPAAHQLDFNSADELGHYDDRGDGPADHLPDYDLATLSDEEDAELRTCSDLTAAVPAPPRQLTLDRQLTKSVVISWTPPDASASASASAVEFYHVYVDGVLRCTVGAGERPRALLEDVDATRSRRISVRSVARDRRTSADPACTMLLGPSAPIAPASVRATGVTATSAVIVWMPSNSNYQHGVSVNSVEVRTVRPGVYRHTITGIAPNTLYRVSVTVKNAHVLQTALGGRTVTRRDRLATHIEFRTLPRGMPDPPVDVQCELGPQERSLLVTWLPVTIDSTSGTSNGAPVTGYAVYADGRKVSELDSPTGDHALVELQQLRGASPRHITVRTKSRDLFSADSLPAPVPPRSNSRLSEVDFDELWPIPEESETELSDEEEAPRAAAAAATRASQLSPRPRRRQTVATPGGHYANYQPAAAGGGARVGHRDATYGGHSDLNDHQPSWAGGGGLRRRTTMPAAGPHDSYDGDGGRRRRGRPPLNSGSGSGSGLAAQYHHQTAMDEHTRVQGRLRGYADGGGGGRRPAAARAERMRVFVALFDYDPPTMSPNPDACDEELPFREGQLLKIYGDKDDDGFFWGEASGRAGLVPCNMVSEVQVDDERVTQQTLREDFHPAVGAAGSRARPQDRWGDIYASTPVHRMVALYDYDPQQLSPNVDAEVELSFRTGDVISVFGDMDDDGFYMGEINGVRGLVPSNFLTDAPQRQERRRGLHPRTAAAGAAAEPGPGVHGPPVPPRDKGDYRDRRKEVGRGDELR